MAGSILGTRVLRTEDPALLTGSARYMDDIDVPGKLHAAFARSELAHARLEDVHIEDALATPGVVAVYTAADLGVAPHHGFVAVHPDFPARRSPTASCASSARRSPWSSPRLTAAADGAAAIWAEYEPLRRWSTPRWRSPPMRRSIFPDHGSNQASSSPSQPSTSRPISDIVVRGRYVNQRMAVVPMEPNGCAAVPDADGRMTFYASTQMPHVVRGQLAGALGIDAGRRAHDRPPGRRRLRRQGRAVPEYSAVAAAARRLGPTGQLDPDPQRGPGLAAPQPRPDPVRRGRMPARRHVHRPAGPPRRRRRRLPGHRRLPARPAPRMSQGTYRFPAIQFDLAVAATNTTPMGAYRGAGRPEATALLERLVDHAALELGIDPIELRQRNFLADDGFPFTTLTGVTYDTGATRHRWTPPPTPSATTSCAPSRRRAGLGATAGRSASASPPTSR